ncbi:hypothetical protein BABINDRAFT_15424 [Babjeviella inositovora NRRL Y-12698]|uniref:Zn(2)-C6 fungal-type domain-containing protein n=1 Tax=Babjeviella inositovora NRRL Y-12698 TaxID=984486 RepID=A0A1E3QJ45_9ASCO|nr:uncharacterized protein BABINDRAFT_15424 [Babjeviella inositovora NRRL Y-12698]ODQ77743.1 hypothetical protein BABINDRAFT_15424 [Babjeviella inositovora NRRL Y-12698]
MGVNSAELSSFVVLASGVNGPEFNSLLIPYLLASLRRKCDEAKPSCENCTSSGRTCGGYGIKLIFDADASRSKTMHNFGVRNGGIVRFETALYDSLDNFLSPLMRNFDSPFDVPAFSLDPEFASPSFNTPNIRDLINGDSSAGGNRLNMNADNREIMTYIDHTNLFSPLADTTLHEENMMLRHFFKKLLPLLDAHPNSPWPELALKYCDLEIARSCFISLSCMHLYESKGGRDFYKKGMHHMHNTMEYLSKYVRRDTVKKDSRRGSAFNADQMDDPRKGSAFNVDQIVGDLKEETQKKQSSFFVILLLIYVHILFAVLENGRSSLSRIFLKLFARISEDHTFQQVLAKIDQSQSLICVLSWFDTITAVVSPDCRLPYCNPTWYGDKHAAISTSRMMGCPGEIFQCIADLCRLKRNMKYNNLTREEILGAFQLVKAHLIAYREYIPLLEDYVIRLKCAQCWSLSTYNALLETVKPEGYSDTIHANLLEFISAYDAIGERSPLVTQMVWPLFEMGCHASTDYTRETMRRCITNLHRNVQMGTISTILRLVEDCWRTGKRSLEMLSGREWLKSGIDFLPV